MEAAFVILLFSLVVAVLGMRAQAQQIAQLKAALEACEAGLAEGRSYRAKYLDLARQRLDEGRNERNKERIGSYCGDSILDAEFLE